MAGSSSMLPRCPLPSTADPTNTGACHTDTTVTRESGAIASTGTFSPQCSTALAISAESNVVRVSTDASARLTTAPVYVETVSSAPQLSETFSSTSKPQPAPSPHHSGQPQDAKTPGRVPGPKVTSSPVSSSNHNGTAATPASMYQQLQQSPVPVSQPSSGGEPRYSVVATSHAHMSTGMSAHLTTAPVYMETVSSAPQLSEYIFINFEATASAFTSPLWTTARCEDSWQSTWTQGYIIASIIKQPQWYRSHFDFDVPAAPAVSCTSFAAFFGRRTSILGSGNLSCSHVDRHVCSSDNRPSLRGDRFFSASTVRDIFVNFEATASAFTSPLWTTARCEDSWQSTWTQGYIIASIIKQPQWYRSHFDFDVPAAPAVSCTSFAAFFGRRTSILGSGNLSCSHVDRHVCSSDNRPSLRGDRFFSASTVRYIFVNFEATASAFTSPLWTTARCEDSWQSTWTQGYIIASIIKQPQWYRSHSGFDVPAAPAVSCTSFAAFFGRRTSILGSGNLSCSHVDRHVCSSDNRPSLHGDRFFSASTVRYIFINFEATASAFTSPLWTTARCEDSWQSTWTQGYIIASIIKQPQWYRSHSGFDVPAAPAVSCTSFAAFFGRRTSILGSGNLSCSHVDRHVCSSDNRPSLRGDRFFSASTVRDIFINFEATASAFTSPLWTTARCEDSWQSTWTQGYIIASIIKQPQWYRSHSGFDVPAAPAVSCTSFAAFFGRRTSILGSGNLSCSHVGRHVCSSDNRPSLRGDRFFSASTVRDIFINFEATASAFTSPLWTTARCEDSWQSTWTQGYIIASIIKQPQWYRSHSGFDVPAAPAVSCTSFAAFFGRRTSILGSGNLSCSHVDRHVCSSDNRPSLRGDRFFSASTVRYIFINFATASAFTSPLRHPTKRNRAHCRSTYLHR